MKFNKAKMLCQNADLIETYQSTKAQTKQCLLLKIRIAPFWSS